MNNHPAISPAFEPIPAGIAGFRYGFTDFDRAPLRVPKLVNNAGLEEPDLTGFGTGFQSYRVLVDVSGHRFLVAGYVIPAAINAIPTNPILEKISPSTKYRGEVVVFAKGVRNGFLQCPANVKKALWTEAVATFVSGVMYALDRGRQPPTHLQALI